jgi:hypothetical protein
MRDLERVKDKIEIRLEPRQVVTLGVATAVFSGVLFAAGYWTGHRQRPEGGAPTGDLARLDAAREGRNAKVSALGDVEFLFPSVVAAGPSRGGPEQVPVRVPAIVVQPSASAEAALPPLGEVPAVPGARGEGTPDPKALAAATTGQPPAPLPPLEGPMAWIFPGQGVALHGLGPRLFEGPPAWRAALEEADAALIEATGVHSWRYKLMAFVVSASLAGLAGALECLSNVMVPSVPRLTEPPPPPPVAATVIVSAPSLTVTVMPEPATIAVPTTSRICSSSPDTSPVAMARSVFRVARVLTSGAPVPAVLR